MEVHNIVFIICVRILCYCARIELLNTILVVEGDHFVHKPSSTKVYQQSMKVESMTCDMNGVIAKLHIQGELQCRK
jgi:hypothetical protein